YGEEEVEDNLEEEEEEILIQTFNSLQKYVIIVDSLAILPGNATVQEEIIEGIPEETLEEDSGARQ
ncbi:Hypothetical predicted protein, partial [Scomber scombrus]